MFRSHLALDVPLAALGVAVVAGGAPGWLPAACAGVAVGVHSWATVHPRSSFYLPVSWRLPATATACALTFDDGPHPEHTPAVLDLLARHGQRATFFVIGEHAVRHGALLRRLRAEGHTLGLHSHHHSRWFNCWPPGRVARDLAACAAAIADATGEPPPRLFRPPVGLKNPLVAVAVRRLRLTTVTWSARLWDTGGATVAALAQRLRAAARPRAIVMMHDGHEPGRPADRAATVAALAAVLPDLTRAGVISRAIVLADDGIQVAA